MAKTKETKIQSFVNHLNNLNDLKHSAEVCINNITKNDPNSNVLTAIYCELVRMNNIAQWNFERNFGINKEI